MRRRAVFLVNFRDDAGIALEHPDTEVMMDGLWQDLRYAVRLLRRTPRNSAIAVAILALGIGANTAMFSAVNQVLILPLPFPDPGRLVRVRDAVVSADGALHPFNMSVRDLVILRESRDLFEGVIGLGGTDMTLIGGETPERVSVVLQTAGNAETLDVHPSLGRGFSEEEERRGQASGVAVISDTLWRTHFGGSAAALGVTFHLDDQPFTVIGVMPPLYAFPYDAQIWIPATLDPADRSQEFAVFARLRPGVSLTAARRALQPVAERVRQQYPDTLASFGFEVITIQENLADNQTGTLRALAMVVGFLLLTACVNVATLLLARSVARRREFAVRAALGASQARHLRQLLAESVVLAALGCGAGLLLALWLSAFTAALIPSVLSGQLGIATLHVDWHVAAFAAAASLLSAAIAAVVPAFGSWRVSPRTALADGGRTATSGQAARLLGLMIVAETAVTLVLLAGSGLMIQNFLRLRSQPLGFVPRGLVTLEVMPSPRAYATGAARDALIRRLLDEVRTVSGVTAAVTTVNPLGGGTWGATVISEEAAARDPHAAFNVNDRLITPGLLETMGVTLLRGRAFTEQDRVGTAGVAIVSERMAARFWPNADAIGRRIRMARSPGEWLTVVGVAGNVADSHDPGVPIETWYRPYAQQADSAEAEKIYFMVRARSGDPLAPVPAIERAIWRVDKTLAPYHVSAMDAYYDMSIARERLGAAFMLALATFGLALAALGVYGVMAFSVGQRTAEIGVRIALGGSARDILPLVLRRGVGLVAAGISLGTVAAVVLNRVLASLLTEVGTLDGAVLCGAAALIALAAVAACVAPALAAARLDPVAALKAD
jgi:putative ABC transport system permease protein